MTHRSGEVRRGRFVDQERRQEVSLRRELCSPQNRNRDMKRDLETKYRIEERSRDRLPKDEKDRRDRKNNEGRDENVRFRENRSERPRRSPVIRKSPPRRSPGGHPGPSDRSRDTRRETRTEVKHEKGSPKPKERKTRFSEADDKNYTWGKTTVKQEGKDPAEKEKPNFGLSGKLTADVNTVNGIVIKYTEPDDAKQPKRRWRFYPFKGDKALPILYIHRQSFFLLGRDKKVVDIHLEHPSVSKQHAALQYRATAFTRADGTQGRRVRPYIIDLESANGTFVNNKKIDPRRYVELLERDVVKFGFSQREYVLLHENSKDDAQDDDQQDPVPSVTTTEQIKQDKRTKMERAADGD
ncbi:Smad nuclear-interacting protein 1 [Eumeta japonica]|uniref:Smad nuclear-interacting protein 1 n=1 Tax=Eumeta variegata TaxID=151549 RepID=A0A4C1Z3K9_EUMVA|nr:Smad nuclear-interacting protein 1 [Eumeta japonica]